MVQERQWPDGEAITLSYDGSGDGPLVVSSAANDSLDRSMTFAVTDGVNNETLVVSQPGLREEYECRDGENYECADGKYGVLKTR